MQWWWWLMLCFIKLMDHMCCWFTNELFCLRLRLVSLIHCVWIFWFSAIDETGGPSTSKVQSPHHSMSHAICLWLSLASITSTRGCTHKKERTKKKEEKSSWWFFPKPESGDRREVRKLTLTDADVLPPSPSFPQRHHCQNGHPWH